MNEVVAGSFPAPPGGKSGWPWTVDEAEAERGERYEGRWPRISIVTPSFGQGRFIEETIRSVLLQDYPNLEYIVMDGGSTDETLAIIKKYEPWISHWESKKDRGQSHAINKGLERATGEIVGWVNSDDYFHPGILRNVAQVHRGSDPDRFWAVFAIEHLEEETGARRLALQADANSLDAWLLAGAQVNQQGAFWARSITRTIGLLDEDLHLGMDTEYFMRMVARGYRMERVDDTVAGTFRIHGSSKTGTSHGEIVDRSQAFLFDWTRARMRHLPRDHAQRRALYREYRRVLSYCECRFGQNRLVTRRTRLSHLLRAFRWNPRCLFSRAFLGGIRRLSER